MQRTMRTTIAALLLAATSLYSIVMSLPLIAQGASSVDAEGNSPPYFILLVGLLLGVLGLVAAFGIWRNQRWAKIVAVLLQALSGLSALPGIFFAPTSALWWSALITVVIAVLVIVLLLWPAPKPAMSGPQSA